MLRAGSALLLLFAPLLGSCSFERSVDEGALKQIAEKCGLVGARLALKEGRSTIVLDGRHNDGTGSVCAGDEVKRRGLSGTIFLDMTKLPPLTDEQFRCIDELQRKHPGLRGREVDKRCGVT